MLYDTLGNYAYRRADEDTRVAEFQNLVGQLTKTGVELGEQTSFEVPELLSISDETIEQFYKDVPELELYRRHFDIIRRKRPHILSEKEEKLLAAAGEMAGAPHRVFSLFSDADMKFPDALDSEGNAHQGHAGHLCGLPEIARPYPPQERLRRLLQRLSEL